MRITDVRTCLAVLIAGSTLYLAAFAQNGAKQKHFAPPVRLRKQNPPIPSRKPQAPSRNLLFTPQDQARTQVTHPLLTPDIMQRVQIQPLRPLPAVAGK